MRPDCVLENTVPESACTGDALGYGASSVHWKQVAWLIGLGLTGSGCGQVIGSDDITFYEPECVTQRDCREYPITDPRICREGRCVALRNDRADTTLREGECPLVLGAENLYSSYPPIVFGAVSDISMKADELRPVTMNFNLAVREFTAKTGFYVRGATHLPVIVVCNAVTDDDTLDESFDHLTSTLGIKGVIAPLPAAGLKRSFERLRDLGRDVFMLSPFGSDSLLELTQDDGLLWHMLGPPIGSGPAYLLLIRRIEDYVNAPDASGVRPPTRLALVDTNLAEDKDLAGYVDSNLVLNGRDAKANGNEYYRRFTATEGDKLSYRHVLDGLVEFRPHIVIILGDDPMLDSVVVPLEGSWATIAPGQAQPFYVLDDHYFGSKSMVALLRNLPGDFRKRMVGVNPAGARDTGLYDSYLREISADNPSGWLLDNIENFYDTAYFMLYAAAAVGPGTGLPSGWELSRAMKRLVHGRRFNVGVADIQNAASWLNASPENTMALYGTLGEPDFDLETGTRRHLEGSVWCVADESDGAFSFRYNVLRVSPDGAALEGEFECFPGF